MASPQPLRGMVGLGLGGLGLGGLGLGGLTKGLGSRLGSRLFALGSGPGPVIGRAASRFIPLQNVFSRETDGAKGRAAAFVGEEGGLVVVALHMRERRLLSGRRGFEEALFFGVSVVGKKETKLIGHTHSPKTKNQNGLLFR
jgi:hypothetical protein